MSLPSTCSKCGAGEWIGTQEVTAPTGDDLWTSRIWHRRTTCRHCGYRQEEIAMSPLTPLTSRDHPLDLIGADPFEQEEAP